MQRNSKGKVGFNRLPIEILLEVYSYLSPKDASSVSLVNKLSNQAAMDNWFWMRKFKQHFPHLFSELSKKNENNIKWENSINWYVMFRNAHYDEYPGNNKREEKRNKKLFPLIKEGDRKGLKKEKIKLDDLERIDKNNITLLEWAKRNKHQALLDYFFKRAIATYSDKHKKLIPAKKDKQGRTILHWAILCHQSRETFEDLIKQGCDPNVINRLSLVDKNEKNYTLLHYAAQEGLAEIVELLIVNHGIKIDTQSTFGITPLLLAILKEDKNIVDILLAYSADHSIAMQQTHDAYKPILAGDTPLHAAIKLGRKDIVESLLDHGADINARTAAGSNALRLAAREGKAEITELLVDRYPDIVNDRGVNGTTALLIAIENGNKNVVDVLLNKKANANIPLQNNTNYHKKFNAIAGDSPLHVAIKLGRKDIVKTLLDHGANINALNAAGSSALYLAAKNGQKDVAKLLIKRGAFIDSDDKMLRLHLWRLSLNVNSILFNPRNVNRVNENRPQQLVMRKN